MRRQLPFRQSVRLRTARSAERIAVKAAGLVRQAVSRRAAHVILAGKDAPAEVRQIERRGAVPAPAVQRGKQGRIRGSWTACP